MEIKVITHILEANERIASQNKQLFDDRGVYVINLMGSPGAGKTTLLEKTIEHLKGTTTLAVIEGDITSSHDAEQIAAHAIPTVQINTGGACHLDGNMVRGALTELTLDNLQLLAPHVPGVIRAPCQQDRPHPLRGLRHGKVHRGGMQGEPTAHHHAHFLQDR